MLVKQPTDFYVVGGTMRPDAASYIERAADRTLLDALIRSEFCYVLTARQMGKSSLMIRTAARLRQLAIQVAVLDLTAVGQNLTPEQWYAGLLVQVGQRVGLEEELVELWPSEPHLGPMHRLIRAVQSVVMTRTEVPLVIFIDEIEAVRSLPFAADEFFIGLRECYNRRSEDAEMRRLTFCLSGVATPSDLIRDSRTTPFNIGRRVELYDFSFEEAMPLAKGLGRGNKSAETLLKRILYWTNGHPYLTQRLCQAVAEDDDVANDHDIDRHCESLFFSSRAQERDHNLQFVRDRMLRSGLDLTSLLDLYSKVLRNQSVGDHDTNPLVSVLRLSGISRTDGGLLRVRNRIYEHVFDRRWIRLNLPDADLRRQRAAYLRGVSRMALLGTVILVLVGWLAFTAMKQRNLALQRAAENRKLFYSAQMKVVQQEWDNANIDRVEELLKSLVPASGEDDSRGFEWYILQYLTRLDLFRVQEDRRIAGVSFLSNDKLAVCEVLGAKAGAASGLLFRVLALKDGSEVCSHSVAAGTNFDPVAFSQDGRYAAAEAPANGIAVWDLASGEQFRSFPGFGSAVTAIAYSRDGRLLAMGSLDGHAAICNLETGERRRLKRGPERIWDVAFSPHGGSLAIADASRRVTVLDVITRHTRSLINVNEEPGRVCFFPDGKRLAIGTNDGALHFAAVRTGRVSATFPPRAGSGRGHKGEIKVLKFSPDGAILATAGLDRTVCLWDVRTGQIRLSLKGHGSAVNSLSWSSDASSIVTGSQDGTVKIWEPKNLEPALPADRIKEFFATSFMANGDLIGLGTNQQQETKIWNLSTGEVISRLAEDGSLMLCAAFSHDNTLAATGGTRGSVKLWDFATGRLIRELPGHTSAVYGLDFSPEGRLISGGHDKRLLLWDAHTGALIRSLDSGVENYYRAVFSADGGMIASACADGSIKVWDAESLTVKHTLFGHTDAVRALAFSRNGALLASGGMDNTVRLWDVNAGTQLSLLGQADSIQRDAFSVDGSRLVTGGMDGSVKLWDLTSMQELITLHQHFDQVRSITFSANGSAVATSAKDGTVKLWRAGSKR